MVWENAGSSSVGVVMAVEVQAPPNGFFDRWATGKRTKGWKPVGVS